MQSRLLAFGIAVMIGAAACAPSEHLTDPNNPAGAGTLLIRAERDTTVTIDTLVVGDKDWLMVLGDTTAVVAWTVRDSSIVAILDRYFSRVQIRALRAGRTTLMALHEGDTATFDIVVRELQPSDTALSVVISTPAVDSALVGDTVPFGFNVWRRGEVVFGIPCALTLSDSTVLRLVRQYYGSYFLATKTGNTFLTVTCEGRSDSSQVVVHDPPAIIPDRRAERYEMIDLGSLGGATTQPLALNDSGQVVGYSLAANGEQHAFLWGHGVMHDLSQTGETHGTAGAITNSGLVAGAFGSPAAVVLWNDGIATDLGSVSCCDQRIGIIGLTATDVVAWAGGPENYRSAIWRSGLKRDLGGLNPQWGYARAQAMNGRGQVVGWSSIDAYAGNTINHPFIWENGVMRELPLLGTYDCDVYNRGKLCGHGEASDINSDGIVIGTTTSARSDETYGVVWTNGEISDVLGWIHPVAINDKGDIVSDGYGDGYFKAHGQLSVQIGSLGGRGTTVADMNDRAMVVGSSWTSGFTQHAFVWQPGEATPIDLGVGPGTGGRVGSAATAINSRGDIIGWWAPCTTPSGRCTELDQSRARAILWRLKP